MPIKTITKTPIEAPVLLAGWPGMGNVGIGAADYLRRKLSGRLCAKMDVTKCCFPDSIDVESGIGRIPAPPAHDIYCVADPPLLIFESETQLSGSAGITVADELLDFAQSHGVKTVYTGAAFASPVSFREKVKVYGVATDDRLRQTFPTLGVEPLREGKISGLNGLLLGLAGTRGMAAACFLATMPHYAIQSPNPRASKAVVHVFEQILNTTVDMAEIDAAIAESDRVLGEFEERVNAAIQSLKRQFEERGGESEEEGEESPEPHEVMDRIEGLFEMVQHDKAKAPMLKEELDRWGLFSLYEDRFLDLFDKNKH